MEVSLTPDIVCGLPVWGNDPRWSLLGYAFDPPTRAPGVGDADVVTQNGARGTPSFLLAWAEDLLQVRGVLVFFVQWLTYFASRLRSMAEVCVLLSSAHDAFAFVYLGYWVLEWNLGSRCVR